MRTPIPVSCGNPWIVQAKPPHPHGREDVKFFRVVAIDAATGELLAAPSTDESAEPIRFPSQPLSTTEHGATNWLFADGKQAWAFCAAAGFRFPVVGRAA